MDNSCGEGGTTFEPQAWTCIAELLAEVDLNPGGTPDHLTLGPGDYENMAGFLLIAAGV